MKVTAWAVFTPKGKLFVWSINETRKGAVYDGCMEFSGRQGPSPNHWESLKKEGFTVRKIEIKEAVK